MSSLIEQAAQRLEQLRQAGVTVPETEPVAPAASVPAAVVPEAVVPAAEPTRASRRVEGG